MHPAPESVPPTQRSRMTALAARGYPRSTTSIRMPGCRRRSSYASSAPSAHARQYADVLEARLREIAAAQSEQNAGAGAQARAREIPERITIHPHHATDAGL